ncbi:unnamed protein product [Diabrotica balteata]|uniref:CCHC-type domain-containing protein n=1 Tax=Diabrotica balteata TaxID=107213 RepID=A0A9N9TCR2_DIABA|nr:unnamed protein product [Diabrotica balteata]
MYKSRDTRSSRISDTLSISSLSDIDEFVNNGTPRDEVRRTTNYNSRDNSYETRDSRSLHPENKVSVDASLDPSVCDFQDLVHSNERQDYRDKRSNSDREGGRYRDRPSYEGKSYDDGRREYRGKRKSSNDRSEKDKRPVFDRLGYGATKSDHEERTHDKCDHKESRSSRLSRLEKMVEKLVENTLENTKPTPKSSDFVPSQGTSVEVVGRSFNLMTSAWLNKISIDCLEKNFDDRMCINFLQSNLSGLMKAWFKTIDAFEFTWPELKMLIIQTFPDTVDFASTLRLLVDRLKQPSETITQYYFSKMYLAEACKISGSNAVSCLIDGLNDPDLQKYAREQNFISPETFYAQFLVQLPNFGIAQPVHEPVHEQDEFPEKGKKRSLEERLDLQKCSICDKYNHTTADCFHRKKSQKCYNCGKFGHIRAECYK